MKNPRFFLEHIMESIKRIEAYIQKTTKDEFQDAVQVQDAVIRRLEIIGEAIKSVPTAFRKRYPDVPWKHIAGLRDVLIHAYFQVDLDLVWKTLTEDIPVLKRNILSILKEI